MPCSRRRSCDGDDGRVSAYITSIQNKYANTGFPWPFYNAEAGWFIRANNFMLGRGLEATGVVRFQSSDPLPQCASFLAALCFGTQEGRRDSGNKKIL